MESVFLQIFEKIFDILKSLKAICTKKAPKMQKNNVANQSLTLFGEKEVIYDPTPLCFSDFQFLLAIDIILKRFYNS